MEFISRNSCWTTYVDSFQKRFWKNLSLNSYGSEFSVSFKMNLNVLGINLLCASARSCREVLSSLELFLHSLRSRVFPCTCVFFLPSQYSCLSLKSISIVTSPGYAPQELEASPSPCTLIYAAYTSSV